MRTTTTMVMSIRTKAATTTTTMDTKKTTTSRPLGAFSGLWFLDPAIGILGGAVILRWSISLSRQSARQLLDMTPSAELEARIRSAVEAAEADTRVADLHVWSLGPAGHGCVVRVVTGVTDSAESLRKRIQLAVPLAHLTVEVHRCPEH